MPSRLSSWLQRKSALLSLRRRNGQTQPEAAPARPLPFLPAQRPRPLTPTSPPSSSSSSPEQHLTAATANSDFFQRLPADLRRMVLIEAFGHRTLHMDLSYDHPLDISHATELTKDERATAAATTTTAQQQRHEQHCGMHYASRVNGTPARRTGEPKDWQWFSCVCHRDPAYRVRGGGRASRKWRGDDPVCEAWTDRCLEGADDWCHRWPGLKPGKCFVGVMGWLRSCRQAYIEGVEVLYSTNTFHMSSIIMISNLPGLLVRPELITSIEMVWRLGAVARPPAGHDHVAASDERFLGWNTFNSLSEAVPATFPKLRHLDVSLLGTWYPPQMAPNDRVRRSENDILAPVDAMVRKLGSTLQECNVSIPASIFRARLDTDVAASKGKYERSDVAHVADRVWRCLPSVQQEDQGNDADSDGDQETEDRGYWIKEGKEDEPYPFAHMITN